MIERKKQELDVSMHNIQVHYDNKMSEGRFSRLGSTNRNREEARKKMGSETSERGTKFY